ncbi:hypothetical protein B0H34DRAFT_863730 [Crassisporium funariophilum]|nr:hypothetical protein B0H34DRAFT_863730 [Crassisporium funariophilum]
MPQGYVSTSREHCHDDATLELCVVYRHLPCPKTTYRLPANAVTARRLLSVNYAMYQVLHEVSTPSMPRDDLSTSRDRCHDEAGLEITTTLCVRYRLRTCPETTYRLPPIAFATRFMPSIDLSVSTGLLPETTYRLPAIAVTTRRHFNTTM